MEAKGAEHLINAAYLQKRAPNLAAETLMDLERATATERQRDPSRDPVNAFSQAQTDLLGFVHNCTEFDQFGEKVDPNRLAHADKSPSARQLMYLAGSLINRYHHDIQVTAAGGKTLTDEQLNPPLSKLFQKIVQIRQNEDRAI